MLCGSIPQGMQCGWKDQHAQLRKQKGKMNNAHNNAIHCIHPVKNGGIWRFSDAALQISHEPFVGDINVMIDHMVKDIPDAKSGFTAYFADEPFPKAHHHMEKVEDDSGGATYNFHGVVGWLCPCLLKFFPTPPDHIYIAVEPLRAS